MSLLYRSIYLTLKGWKTAKKMIAELESTKHLNFTHDVVPAIYLPWFPTLYMFEAILPIVYHKYIL